MMKKLVIVLKKFSFCSKFYLYHWPHSVIIRASTPLVVCIAELHNLPSCVLLRNSAWMFRSMRSQVSPPCVRNLSSSPSCQRVHRTFATLRCTYAYPVQRTNFQRSITYSHDGTRISIFDWQQKYSTLYYVLLETVKKRKHNYLQ